MRHLGEPAALVAATGRHLLELHTLGGLWLRRNGDAGPRAIALQSKRLVLLAFLAASPAQTLRRRDSLLGLFWPELDQEHARGALRQALHALRTSLGEGVILTRGESEVGIDHVLLLSDARALQAAVEAGSPRDALALYRGDFLEGVFVAESSPELDEWIAGERDRLRGLVARAAWEVAEASGGEDGVGGLVRRAVRLSGDDEGALRRGIILLDQVGDHAGAIALYEAFAQRVVRNLGVAPSAESRAAIEAIRARAAKLAPFPAGASVHDAALRHEGISGGEGAEPVAPGALVARPGLFLGKRWPAAAMVLVLLSALAGFHWSRLGEESEATIGRLAVLPLANGSSDTTIASVTEALTQEMIATLSRAGFRVIGYYSVDKYRTARPPVAEIGRELGVDAVATWTVLYQGGRWRVALEVARASTGEGLWASTRYILDSLRLGDVAEGAARELATRFASGATRLPPTRARLVTGGAPDAKIAYLRGMNQLVSQPTPGYSIEQFSRAIEADSMFAPGHSGLAYALTVAIDYGVLTVREACRRARPAAARALALDAELASGHLADARVKLHCEWNWTAADAAYRRALALEPTATAYHQYSWFLSWYLGRVREGVAFGDTALALEPLSALHHVAMAWRLFAAGDLDRAEVEVRAAVALDPRTTDAPLILAELHLARGELEAAEREALKHREMPATVAASWSVLGEIYARSGREAEARTYLAQLARSKPRTGSVQTATARLQLALGERDVALTSLERAVDDGVFIIPFQPYWNPIRDHPRFQVLMRRMGL